MKQVAMVVAFVWVNALGCGGADCPAGTRAVYNQSEYEAETGGGDFEQGAQREGDWRYQCVAERP